MQRRALLAAAASLLCVGCARPAVATESLVEGFAAADAFTDRWGMGGVAHGGDAGFAWLELTTSGDARPSLVANRKPYAPALDLRGKFLKLWLRVEGTAGLDGIALRLSSDNFETGSYSLPIALYGDAEFNFVQDGDWTVVTLGFGGAEVRGAPDRGAIDAIGLYVGDRGKGPARVRWGGVAVVDEPAEGVVSFTFDDGYVEHVRVAAPVLARHGLRGTAYVIPDLVGGGDYASLAELHALRDRYGWEVAAHGQDPFTELEPERLEPAVLAIQRYLVSNGFGAGAVHLAYPLGKHDPRVVTPLVRKYFESARIAGGGPETLPPADRHRLRVVNVTSRTTPAEIVGAARRAQRHHEWLILMFHYLVEGEPQGLTEFGIGDFEVAVRELRRTGVTVLPVGEVLARLRAETPRAVPAAAAAAPPSPEPRALGARGPHR